MADTGSTLTIQPTALVALLESTHISHQLAAYRGASTPQQLDAPEVETAALTKGAAIHDLGWMRRVAVRGLDRFRWLSGMVSNTVNDLFPNTGAWNFVLTPQGRIQGDLTVWRRGEETSPVRRKPGTLRPMSADNSGGTPFAGESGLELEIAADQYDRLLAHLNRYIIMDDVELVPLGEEQGSEGDEQTAIGLGGPLADEVLERMGLPVFAQPMTGRSVEWNGWDLRILRNYGLLTPHYEIFLPSAGLGKLWSCLRAAGADPVGCAAVEALRVAEAIPLYGIDISDRDLPQETSQMRALHFNKGCYLGQEIVERIRARGSVHRHLRPMEVSGAVPPAGIELMLEGAVAGHITSASALKLGEGTRVFALGMIKAEAETRSQEFQFTMGETMGTARILDAPPELEFGWSGEIR
jgi:folate-binding protein YgfZ